MKKLALLFLTLFAVAGCGSNDTTALEQEVLLARGENATLKIKVAKLESDVTTLKKMVDILKTDLGQPILKGKIVALEQETAILREYLDKTRTITAQFIRKTAQAIEILQKR